MKSNRYRMMSAVQRNQNVQSLDMGTWTSNKVNGEDFSFNFIELFAGVGGFRIALDKLAGHCVFASEIDRFCVKNYESNFKKGQLEIYVK